MQKFNLWLMMIPPAWLGGTVTLICTWIGPNPFSDPVRLIFATLFSIIPIFTPFLATYYVVQHIENEFWKIERKLSDENELIQLLESVREKSKD
jgi:hypothetical protein